MTAVTDRRAGEADTAFIPATVAGQEGADMKSNAGSLDRGLRIAAGLALVVLAATGTVGVWGWIGVVPLATGLLGWCPAYTLLGINTCPMKSVK